jgi:2,3-bisphosphoglycerate-independent phosphoglycerate mutase
MPEHRPVMLVILDGWGWREDPTDNAVRQARTPTFDKLWRSCPHAFLRTSGKDVGLPDGQMGNSEVGHLNIGAGRVVMQDLPHIDDAIRDGSSAKLHANSEVIFACYVLVLESQANNIYAFFSNRIEFQTRL